MFFVLFFHFCFAVVLRLCALCVAFVCPVVLPFGSGFGETDTTVPDDNDDMTSFSCQQTAAIDTCDLCTRASSWEGSGTSGQPRKGGPTR